MPKLTYVIVYRYHPQRVQLLDWTIQNLREQDESNIEIIISEEGLAQTKPKMDGVDRCLFTESTEAFSRAQSANVGVVAATSNNIVIHDGDILVPPYYSTLMIEKLKSRGIAHLSKDAMKLSSKATKRVLAKEVDPWDEELLNCGEHWQRQVSGMSMGLWKSCYERLGGMNEQYVGWGAEDSEFMRIAKNKKVLSRCNLARIVHLWHPDAPRDNNNRKLYKESKTKCIDYIIQVNHKHYMEKYYG